jgi:hypothetical protein
MGMWQAGGISRQTLFWNLQQGELVQQGRTLEDEVADIESEAPALGMMSGADGQ